MAKPEWFQEWFHTGFKRLPNCRRLGDEMSLDTAALTGGRVFRRVVEAILYDRSYTTASQHVDVIMSKAHARIQKRRSESGNRRRKKKLDQLI